MASIAKHGNDTVYYLRHNLRELPDGKQHGNEDIDPERSSDNYSLVVRGQTADEINAYRHALEREIYAYNNRRDLVRTVEIIITLPEDCKTEHAFFEECYKYVVSLLPMGERCVLQAVVHKDEGGQPHIHIVFVPAIKNNVSNGYNYRLSAHQLITNKSKMKQFHPKLQKWLDTAGIKASVKNGATGGKNVKVSELKQLTKATGLTLQEAKELAKDKEREWGNTSTWGATKDRGDKTW